MAIKLFYTDPTSKTVKQYLVDEIDAYDAVRRFPGDYALEAPAKATVEEVKTPQSAMASGENIVMPTADTATATQTAAPQTAAMTATTGAAAS